MGEERELIELKNRQGDGIDVVLKWVKGTLSTVVEVVDHRLPEVFSIEVPEGIKPNEVFLHPYAYREETNG